MFNSHMKTIEQIWFENIKELVRRKYSGKSSAFADAIDRPATMVSGYIGKKPRKVFGKELVRYIESCHDLPKGFLDQENAFTGDTAAAVLLDRISSDFKVLSAEDQVHVFEYIQELKRQSKS